MGKKKKSLGVNPVEAHRRAQRKRESAKNKKEKAEKRQVAGYLKDPSLILQEVEDLKSKEGKGKLDASGYQRKKDLLELYRTLMRKQREAGVPGAAAAEERGKAASIISSFSAEGKGRVIKQKTEEERLEEARQVAATAQSAVGPPPGTGRGPPKGRPRPPPPSRGHPPPPPPPRPGMATAGMAGVPPPPPRPGMPVAGMAGVPPPPPRPGMAAAGMAGVPPPPPRPGMPTAGMPAPPAQTGMATAGVAKGPGIYAGPGGGGYGAALEGPRPSAGPGPRPRPAPRQPTQDAESDPLLSSTPLDYTRRGLGVEEREKKEREEEKARKEEERRSLMALREEYQRRRQLSEEEEAAAKAPAPEIGARMRSLVPTALRGKAKAAAPAQGPPPSAADAASTAPASSVPVSAVPAPAPAATSFFGSVVGGGAAASRPYTAPGTGVGVGVARPPGMRPRAAVAGPARAKEMLQRTSQIMQQQQQRGERQGVSGSGNAGQGQAVGDDDEALGEFLSDLRSMGAM